MTEHADRHLPDVEGAARHAGRLLSRAEVVVEDLTA